MPDKDWLPPQQYYASLAKNITAAGALFTDAAGRVLIVKPHYRDHWLLVGGVRDDGETPEQTCRREVAEEIGIDQSVGRLLLVDWTPPSPIRPLPMIEFIFDGGVIEPERVRLGDDELDAYRFLRTEQALPLLSGHGRRRLTEALEARRTGTTRYRSDGG